MNVTTLTGNATDDAELRFTNSGTAVAVFRLAVNDRYIDRTSGEWKDGDPLFLSVSAWSTLGTNVAHSVKKGDRVTVTGKLTQRTYEKDGTERTVTELKASDVALSLYNATATAIRNVREPATV